MRRRALPDHLTTGSFSLRASDKAGVTRTRTAAKDLVTVSRGIRVPVQSKAAGAAALRAYTDLDDTSILASLSAARVWEAPLAAGPGSDWRIHLARRRGFSFPRRANVVGHLLTFLPDEVVEYDGVRLTSPARTWLDLASVLALEDLVAVGDHMVCFHGPAFPHPRAALCGLDDLNRMTARHPGMRGVKSARAALELIRVGADSAPETHMRLALVGGGLPEPVLNHVVRNSHGIPTLWPDAAYPQWGIALQYDGRHHADHDQHVRDMERHDRTLALGWLEVRVGRQHLDGDRPAVVRKVREALEGRGWTRGGS
ncbi:endonuclease domain-containing protein [Arthrobacter sp. C152]